MNNKKNLLTTWLVVAVISGFAAIIFFAITYLNNSAFCSMNCRLKNEVTLVLILLSIFGVFIGSLAFYLISGKYEKKIKTMNKDIKATFKFLEPEERIILKELIRNKGVSTQSSIAKNTTLNRVQVYRTLRSLENKGIIKKEDSGRTNKIILDKELKEIFL